MMNRTSTETIEELKRIAGKHRGLLFPDDVVKEARPANSPLHSHFEWDDGRAAQQHRLWQARQLICVSVEVIEHSDAKVQSKVFVSLLSDRHHNGGYRTLVDVMRHPDRKSELMQDALREMELFEKKYKALQELGEVFEAMEHVKGAARLK
jgi:hypothetical protein